MLLIFCTLRFKSWTSNHCRTIQLLPLSDDNLADATAFRRLITIDGNRLQSTLSKKVVLHPHHEPMLLAYMLVQLASLPKQTRCESSAGQSPSWDTKPPLILSNVRCLVRIDKCLSDQKIPVIQTNVLIRRNARQHAEILCCRAPPGPTSKK